MFYISLIVCIISCVIAVQPINSTANSKLAQTEHQNAGNFYSDSGSIIGQPNGKPDTKSISSIDPVAEAATKTHIRRVSKTDPDLAPPEVDHSNNNDADSGQNGRKNEANSSKNSQISNTNTANATMKVNQDAIKLIESGNNSKSTNLNITKTNPASNTKSTTAATSKSTTTKSTTTTTTKPTTKTTTTTTTTTTPKPKKPLITLSVEDIPGLISKAESNPKLPKIPPPEDINGPHSLESSEMITYQDHRSNHNYLMAMIGIIVVIPLIIVGTNCAVRKVRDVWSKRRYRRMDYLIEDMYN